MLLILFAAGLFAKAFHEFRALFGIEWSVVASRVWDVQSGPLAKGATLHDFLKGLFGWSPNPERVRVAAYFAYLVPVGWFFLKGSARPSPKHESKVQLSQKVEA